MTETTEIINLIALNEQHNELLLGIFKEFKEISYEIDKLKVLKNELLKFKNHLSTEEVMEIKVSEIITKNFLKFIDKTTEEIELANDNVTEEEK